MLEELFYNYCIFGVAISACILIGEYYEKTLFWLFTRKNLPHWIHVSETHYNNNNEPKSTLMLCLLIAIPVVNLIFITIVIYARHKH